MHPQKGPQLLTLAEILNFWVQTDVGINTASWSHHRANTKMPWKQGLPSLACTQEDNPGVCMCLPSI